MSKQPSYFRINTVHNGKKIVKYLAHVGGMTDHEIGDLIDAILKDMKIPKKAKQNRPKVRQDRSRTR